MLFESLPNELIMEIFEQLNSIQLLEAFYGLTYRLNDLLFIYFRLHPLHFQDINQRQMIAFSHNQQPCILNKIYSIILSDDDLTPHLSTLFLAQSLSLNQFLHLQSLTLHKIHSFNVLNEMIQQCRHLSQFHHLKLLQCGYYLQKVELFTLTNNVWSLPKLFSCQIDCFSIGRMNFPRITQSSSTIRSITFTNLHADLNDLAHLLKQTSALESLHQKIECNFPNEQLRFTFSSLISLHLIFEGSKYSLESLLKHVTNLKYLTLHLIGIHFDGFEWEQILINHLTNVQIFRFKADFTHMGEENIRSLVLSFSNAFWINTRRWFVRCDWNSFKAVLYTLPYEFSEFTYWQYEKSLSTCANSIDNFQFYRHVNKLTFETHLSEYPIRFDRIVHFDSHCSFNRDIGQTLSNLNHLRSINIAIQNEFSYVSFEEFLHRAHRLDLLKVKYFHTFPSKLFEIKTSAIPRIDLIGDASWHVHYCNDVECDIVFTSSLGQKCQCLSISFAHRSDILRCLRTMPKLQSLILRCYEKENTDELDRWMKNEIPITHMFARDPRDRSICRLWLNK